MAKKSFDIALADSQGTEILPMDPAKFELSRYGEYEAALMEHNKDFWQSKSGVAVYRRFRVPEVFSYGCKDMKNSLELQLAALTESMKYKSDMANFLEPWYGIGTVQSAYGIDYVWHDGQAPATMAPFRSIQEALSYDYISIEKTQIGRHTLEMIEYFLDKTKGKVPMSLTDVQSPLNVAASLVDINSLFMEIYDNPKGYCTLLSNISDLLIEFTKQQMNLIGGALAKPGHGFASSRAFTGIGMSDDNALMISNKMFEEYEIPEREKIGAEFGGAVFHSCGDWSGKIPVVKKIKNLVMADGAFSEETDPGSIKDLELFRDQFVNTGIVLNARIVGDVDTILENVQRLWAPGMKLVVVTYCKTVEEQESAYNKIHEICG